MTKIFEDDLSAIIQTRSGVLFDIFQPDPHCIAIEDIAISLARICRFNGHTRRFYSVAEHCINTSRLLADHPKYGHTLALEGLIHDWHEAYTGDIAGPFKKILIGLVGTAELRIDDAIRKRFKFPPMPEEIHDIVKSADRTMLYLESRSLMTARGMQWDYDVDKMYQAGANDSAMAVTVQEIVEDILGEAPSEREVVDRLINCFLELIHDG